MNNLTVKVFEDCMQDLVDYYPSWGINCEESSVMTKWYKMFAPIDDSTFIMCVKKHIETVPYNPTVASLLEIYKTKCRRTIYD